jgi:hypothetical protein
MNVVVVRTWKLPAPVDVPVLEHFAGCKSWVPLDEMVSVDGSTPALDEDTHDARVDRINAAIGSERVAI